MLLTLELIKNHQGVPLTREYLIDKGLVQNHRSAARTQDLLTTRPDKYLIDITEEYVITVTEAFKGSVSELFIATHDLRDFSSEELASRWGCHKTQVYKWIWGPNRDTTVRLLIQGLRFKPCNDLIDDLVHECHSRGFGLKELARNAGVSLNGIKGWSRDEERVGRLWDLIRGYEYASISR